ncbi:MAG: hypothetical protein WC681_12765 [Sterolibacterium sp.]|jgi:hypothetical protein
MTARRNVLTRRQRLTPKQRLNLATDILRLVESRYARKAFEGQDEALGLALIAMTSARDARELLGAG